MPEYRIARSLELLTNPIKTGVDLALVDAMPMKTEKSYMLQGIVYLRDDSLALSGHIAGEQAEVDGRDSGHTTGGQYTSRPHLTSVTHQQMVARLRSSW